MTVSINGTSGIVNDATDLNYTGTLTGDTGVVNLGSGQVYKDASGNVGIGTSSPTNKLVVGGGVVAAGLANTYNIDGVVFEYGAAISKILACRSGGNYSQLTFATAGANSSGVVTERARIDSSGNLLVGTTSASYGARSVIQNNGTTTQPSISCINSTGSGTMRQIDFFTGSNTSRIGSIESTTSTTAYNTSSDYRLKENIAPMTGALAAVTALNPVTYTWKVDGFAGQGFIAHELAEVCPDAVSGEKDAVDADGNPQYQGIDTSFLVATLAAAIQELKAVVDAQAARITALEGTAA